MKKMIVKHMWFAAFMSLASLNGSAQPFAGKTIRIALDEQGHVLTAENSSLAAGSKVMTWSETHVPAQRWQVEKTQDEEGIALRNAYTGLYLHSSLTQSPTKGIWVMEPVASKPHTFTLLP